MGMLACIVIMAGAVRNVLPWGGPTARVMSSLKLEAHDVFVPLIPAMIVTALWVILVAWYFGLKERARLGRLAAESIGVPLSDDDPETPCATRSEEHTSELQSLMRISYAVFCLKQQTDQCTSATSPSILTRPIVCQHSISLTYQQTHT